MQPFPSILIIEDEMLIALALELELREAGYPVCGIAAGKADGVEMALRLKPGVILLDVGLRGELDGFTIAEEIQTVEDIPIVFVSGYLDESNREIAARYHPLACLSKPVSIAQLTAVLRGVS